MWRLQLGSTQDCRSISWRSFGIAAVTALQPCVPGGGCHVLRVQKGDGDSLKAHAPLFNPVLSSLNLMQLVSLLAKYLKLGHYSAHSSWSVPLYKTHCAHYKTLYPLPGGWQRLLPSVDLPAAVWHVLEEPGSEEHGVGPCTTAHAAARCPAEASHHSLLLLHITDEENPHACSARRCSQDLFGPASSLGLCSYSFSFPSRALIAAVRLRAKRCTVQITHLFPQSSRMARLALASFPLGLLMALTPPLEIILWGHGLYTFAQTDVHSDWCSLLCTLSGGGPAEPVEGVFGSQSRETLLALPLQRKNISGLGWLDRTWPLGFIA